MLEENGDSIWTSLSVKSDYFCVPPLSTKSVLELNKVVLLEIVSFEEFCFEAKLSMICILSTLVLPKVLEIDMSKK